MNRGKPKLLLITGLPASGKTTLARALASRYGVPYLAKDSIKEPLFDVLGAESAAHSRKLSDASFAVMFALTRDLLAADVSVVLEGNFRAGEHEAPLRALLQSAHSLAASQWSVRGETVIANAAPPTAGREAVVHSASAQSASGVESPPSAAPARESLAYVAQLLCRTDEVERAQRLAARATDSTRHPGHRDAHLIGVSAPRSETFLSLEGERLLYEGERTLIALDAWWRG